MMHHCDVNVVQDKPQTIQRSIDTEMVKAYWLIGQEIVEEEQHGKKRAEYGNFVLQALSERLTIKYGRGFGITTLRDIRQFYLSYPSVSIHHAPRGESGVGLNPNLGWIHYRALMRVHRPEARQFYELEAELKREIKEIQHQLKVNKKNRFI